MIAVPSSSLIDAGVSRCVIFGGGLKASPLQSLCRCSVLDLHIIPSMSVLDLVLGRVAELSAGDGGPLPVRVGFGEPVPAPAAPRARDGLEVAIVSEPQRWRGPAGLLLDLCADLSGDALILVLEGARWFGCSLAPLLVQHSRHAPDVTIATAQDSTPAGAYIVRRSALDQVPRLGFLDLKEQFFGRLLAGSARLSVCPLEHARSIPLRTLADFLSAARFAGGSPPDWSLIDPAADVDPTAVIISSVVMRGARIGPGALVARSLVLDGGVVKTGTETVDSVVQPGGTRGATGGFRAVRAPKEHR
jgi:hypothetical protein